MKSINVGIDLGTTYSAVAWFDEASGKVEIFNNDLGESTTPSVVSIENGVVQIGALAKETQAAGSADVAAFYKSMMGEENFRPYIDGKNYTAEDLSGIFLTQLKKAVEKANNIDIAGAVITVPAYFNEAQRQATIRAGEKAGLKVLKIINEPTAAIIAYGLTGGAPKTVMVYDLGGGTFDVTIAKIDGSNVSVIATNGNHQLGGKDWDKTIVDEVDISTHLEDMNELTVKCEKAKKQLSEMNSTLVSIQCEGFYGKYSITKEFFEEQTEGLLNETILLCQQCFDDIGGGFGWRSLDEVVLVGGSTRMPQVLEIIKKEFGKQPRLIGNKVDTIVAAGAAMQAHLCVVGSLTLNPINLGTAQFKDGKPVGPLASLTLNANSIKDVTSHSLGMLAFANDGNSIINSIIIKKNSTVGVPHGKHYSFRGDKLEAYVLQGESNDPYDCTLLYKYLARGMQKGYENKFTINFLYNQNGVVEVTGKLDDGTELIVEKSAVTESIEDIIARLIREKKEAEKRAKAEITFAIDTSGSMAGESIREAKNSIDQFVDQLGGSKVAISLISFANDCNLLCKKTDNFKDVKNAARRLDANGGTNADPIGYYSDKLDSYEHNRILIVLTDGEWFRQDDAIISADRVKRNGTKIYAIGIGDADYEFLRKIASPDGARKIDLSKLVATFKEISVAIATESNDSSGTTLA